MTSARPHEPLRVLWLIKGLGRGGAETILEAALERFDPDVVEVDVAYVLPHKDALLPRLLDLGISVYCLSGPESGRWPLKLRELMRQNKYDIVHSHSPLLGVAARLVSGPRQVLLHTEHDVWEQYVLPTRLMNALTMRRNSRVFAISQAARRSMRSSRLRLFAPERRTEVLYHGLDLTRGSRGLTAREQARERVGLDSDEFALVMVASMTARKNHETLLRAIRLMADRGDRVRLFLVGGGPLDEQIRSQVNHAGLGDQVEFMGVRADVHDILPAFDALVLPSKNEGLGMVLIEALNAGIPVIASRVGGIPEVLGDFPGAIMVPPHDPERLSEAICRVREDPSVTATAQADGPRHASRFDIDHAVRGMTEAYQAAARAAT